MYGCIKPFYKFNRLKIFFSALCVFYPLTVTAVIVKIKHRGNGVNSYSVNMILINPEHCA